MALRRAYKKRFKGVNLKSGNFYTFKYQAWEHDPKPTIIFMYAIEGIHPRTGHQWRLIQAINFTYIPRQVRRRFLAAWKKEMERGLNTRFTYQKLKRRWPYLKIATRRYFLKPTYYIKDLKEIPFDQIDRVVVSTWSKDFSKKVVSTLLSKFKTAMNFRKKLAKKKKKKAMARKK